MLRDANDEQGSRAWWLDITLRRGSQFASFVCTWNGAAKIIELRHTVGVACTAVTPAGASGPLGMRATADDGDGNRIVMACPNTQTQTLGTGRISQAATKVFPFMIGSELDGSGAGTGDTATDVISQYLGHVSEVVRAVPR